MAKSETITGINLERVSWCCMEAGISIPELAGVLKITRQGLESGALTFRQLQKLANHFGYGVLFFLEKGVPQPERVYSPAFRTLVNQDMLRDGKLSKLLRNLEKHRDFYVNLLEENDPNAPLFEPPKLTGETLKGKALEARKWLGIDGVSTRLDFKAYRKLLERKQLFVLLSSGYQGQWRVETEGLEGFSIRGEKMPIIFVRKTHEKRQVFTLFHELGHLLLHDDRARMDFGGNFSSHIHSGKEKEANSFAGYCLLPDKLLDEVGTIPKSATDYDDAFGALGRHLCVSVEVILVRLLREGKIRPADYDAYKEIGPVAAKQQAADGSRQRHTEPVRIFGAPYVQAVLSALNDERITLNKASDFLDRIKLKQFEALRGHALRP